MSTSQVIARRILRDAARTSTLRDLWIATDEEDLTPPDPEGNPEDYAPGPWTSTYLWIDEAARTADLSVRWATDGDGGYQAAADPDDPDAAYGDVSLRYVTRVKRADRARIAALIEFTLKEAGYDPAEFSIGGDPREEK
jgi:hypothetical protein